LVEPTPDLVTWATFITAIATLATVIIIVWQTVLSKRASQSEFTLRLHNDFYFHEKNSKIIRAIEYGNPLLAKNGGDFIESDLDDYLGVIQLLKIYIDKGSLSEQTVDDMFGYYIVKTWETPEIQDYVKTIRKEQHNDDYYSGLESMATKFKYTP
jgi:hypothetical protein